MKTWNVCRVITRLPVGGIERRLAASLPELNQPPFSVRVVCLREFGELAAELRTRGVPVDLVPLKSRLSPTGIRELARYFQQHRIHVVHAHMYRAYLPATIASHKAGVPVMFGHVHNVDTWESFRQKIMDRFLCRYRTGMIAVSRRVKENVLEQLQCPPDFVHVIYNGVELERFRNAPVDLALKAELGIDGGELVGVVVARLKPQKNHRLLFQALAERRAELANLKILIVGEGQLEVELRQLARDWQLERQIRFCGRRNDVERIYKIADFSILPSDKEGFSNTVIESLAAGCPVIATDVGGNREAILDGETGLIVPPQLSPVWSASTVRKDATLTSSGESTSRLRVRGPRSDEASRRLGAALLKLSSDETLRAKMSAAAVERARVFSLENMLDQTRELYLRHLNHA